MQLPGLLWRLTWMLETRALQLLHLQDKRVTKGQAALALSTGDSAEVVMEEVARIEAEKIAEAAVNAHGALVAQVEKDLNANFERELTKEREKIETLEQLAEEARMELDKLRAEREEDKNALIRGRAAVESEMEVLSKLRCEVEEQLQSVLSKKVEISFEKNRIENLQKEIENENQAVVQLQYELEVERKALSMARAWAEEEANKAREHARALEEARNQWERQGIKVVVEGGLEDDASAGMTLWANAGKEHPVDDAINRAGNGCCQAGERRINLGIPWNKFCSSSSCCYFFCGVVKNAGTGTSTAGSM